MAGWPDLVRRGQPRLLDFQYDATEGRDWEFSVGPFTDGTGAVIDMSAATYVCKVITDVDGTDIATWTVTGDASGYVNGVLADSTTAGTAAGAPAHQGRPCLWFCKGTLSGAVIQFWGPLASKFRIYPE